jgi:hypothetical protein
MEGVSGSLVTIERSGEYYLVIAYRPPLYFNTHSRNSFPVHFGAFSDVSNALILF